MAHRVLCPCCGKSVAKQTRINHVKLRTGNPAIRARAISYRKQVLLEIPSSLEAGNTDDFEPGQDAGLTELRAYTPDGKSFMVT